MKTAATCRLPVLMLAIIAALSTFAIAAFAQSGTWINTAGGSWATAANWSGNTIATGSGNTANFGTLTLGAAPTVTLDGAQTIGSLLFNDVGNTYGWTLNTGSAGPLTLAVSTGSPLITVSNQTTTIGAVLAGTAGLIKSGAGTLVLTAANTYTGTTTITNGTLTYSGSGSSGGSANLNVGGVTGRGVFNMNSSGTVSFVSGTPQLGGNGGASDNGVGALYVSSGTLDLAASGDYLTLGSQAPTVQVQGMGTGSGLAYGYYNQSGGAMNITSAGGVRIAGGGVGVWYQSGGTVSCPRYFSCGGNGTQGGNAVCTLVGGSITVGSAGYYTLLGGKPNSTGILNLGTEAGGTGTFTAGNGSGVLFLSDANATNGTLNLNRGTLIMNGPIQRNSAATSVKDTAIVNCNGGTVQAAAALPSLFTVNSGMTIKFYQGGLTLNSQTYGVTNSATLLAAPGNGFYPSGGTLAVSSGGGAGYIGAPWVYVTNSIGAHGSNAMAIATLSGGAVNSVVITCPGENYQAGDVLDFVFINGGATTAATTFQYTIQASDLSPNNGVLTKLGTGTLLLSASNSYSGGTLLSAGTLDVTADGGLGAGNVSVANGLTLNLSGGVANNYISSSANLVVGSTSVVNLNYSGTDTIYSFSTNGGNTFVSPGVYGSVASGAANTIATFTGSGTLTVLSLPSISVALSSSANPSATRQSVTFTGSVSGNSGTPTGTLTFKNGTNVLGTVTLNGSGMATLTTNFLVVGSYSITATYSGNGSYPAFTSPILTQVVGAGYDLWSGAVSAAWDINTTTNWTQSSVPVTYWDTDTVQFDDSATGTTAVVLNTTVSPSGMVFNNSTNVYSVSGTGTIAGAGGLLMMGSSTVTLSTSNSYTGTTLVSNGVVSISGGGAYSGGSSANLLVGGATGVGVFNMNSTGTVSFTAGTPYIGGTGNSTDTGAGAINQTAGVLNLDAGGNYLTFGGGSNNAYGSYNLSGGTLDITSTAGVRIGEGGLGSYFQSGGTMSCPRYFVVGGNSGAAGSVNLGVATFTGGAAFTTNGYFVIVGDLAGSTGTLNLGTEAGGNATFTTTTGSGPYLGQVSGATGTLNLNSGTLTISGPIETASGGTGTVNLNGGTLQAGANNITLLNTTPSSINLYNGGLVVNSQTNTATISAPLASAAGSGIYPAGGLYTISSGGGSAYIGAPVVAITGGSGSGATAIASVSGGVVTNVTMTCPGQNYQTGDVLTFNFNGGGTANPASAYGYTLQSSDLATNGAGGVTKIGSGTIILSGSLTYSGPTVVSNGTLSLPAGSGSSGAITVSSNATLSAQSAVSAPVTINNGGTLSDPFNANLSLNGVLTLGANPTDVMNLVFSADTTGVDGNYSASSLTVNGTNVVNVTGNLPLVAPATYTLLSYSGAMSGTGTFVTGTLPGLVSGYVTNTGTEVDLVVLSADSLVWTGSPTNNWDLSGTNDWKLASSGSPAHYLNGDDVGFNDSASNFVVNVDTNITPGVVTVNSTNNYLFTGAGSLGGSAQIIKTNSGTLTLIGANNSYTGGTVINGGTVQLGNSLTNGSFGNGVYTVNAGTSLYLDYATATPAGTGLWSSNIVGSGTLELNSAQPINASANWGPNSSTATPFTSAFVGTLQVDNGRMDASPAGLGGITNIVISTNGGQFLAWSGTFSQTASIAGQSGWGETGYPDALRLAGSSTAEWDGNITLTANSGIEVQRSSTFTIAGSITGPYQCQFNTGDPVGANGTLMIEPSAAVQNSYGSTLVTGNGSPGAVEAGNQYAFSPGPLQTASGGTLELYSFDFTFANLSGTGGTVGNFSGTPCTLTVGADNTSTSYGGTIVDGNTAASLAFTKIGGGALTLTANNSFSGGTIVSNGTLAVLGKLSGAGAVAVNAGGTLGGTGMIAGAVSIAPGAALYVGSTATNIGTLSISNTLALSGTVLMKISKTGGVLTNDLVQGLQGVTYGGTLAVTNITSDATALAAGDSFTLFGSTGYTPGFVTTNLPALAAGLAWNTTNLTVNGSIQVVATGSGSAPLTFLKFTGVPVISGTNLMISATNTGAGTVYLLTTTNLAASSSWTPIWTNVLAGNGSFTTNLINAVNPALSQCYYLLSTNNTVTQLP